MGEYTLDEALVAIGFGKYQVYLLGYAGLGYAATGMETMILSFIGPSVKSEWDLSSTQESLFTSVIFVGMFIGAYLSGFISDEYGRRKGLLSVAIVMCGASLLTAFAPNYLSLVILRCLVGVGVGGGGAVYFSWFLEFVPAPNRGTWMIFLSIFWTLGNVIEASLAWIILPRLGWRWLLALSSLPAFPTLLLYNLTPESPRYLCLKSQTSEAQKLLKRAAAVNQTELPSGILVSDQTASSDEEDATTLSDPLLPCQKTNVITTASKTGFSTLRMLFSSSLYKITLQLWVVFFGNNFAYYGIILLTSKLSSVHSDCGSSATLRSDVSQDLSYGDILVAAIAEFPGIVLAAFMIDRIGRKLSMQIMFMLGFVFLLPLLLVQNDTSSTISLVGARIFTMGTITVASIYAPEIYPTSVRATGFGMAGAVGGVGGMLCPLVAVVLLNSCHQTAAIILFEFVIVLSGLCVFLFPFETKGQELSDNVNAIQQNHTIIKEISPKVF